MLKSYLRFPSLLVTATLLVVTARADFHDHLGIQLWSLHAQTMAKGLPPSLDLIKGWGFTEVEGGVSATGPTATQVRAEFDARGLTVPSVHASYEQMTKDLPAVIRDAKILGAKFVICPWIPHESAFDAAKMREAVANFNKWGAAFSAAGLRFGYHPHGYEFVPERHRRRDAAGRPDQGHQPGGRVLRDGCVLGLPRRRRPGEAAAKIFHPLGGAAREGYPQGRPTGSPTGSAPATDNVSVGTGQIDWRAVIGTAEKIGVTYYFIEDETTAPLENVPASLAYLRALKL